MYNHQGYNYVGIPAFEDYKHIKAHYESVAPIRGREVECRPLGRRRYYWYEITQDTRAVDLSPENPLGSFAKTYSCKLGRTNVIEWFPNEDIVLRRCSWGNASNMGILTYALAKHGTVISASGKWYFRNKTGQEFVIPKGKNEELLIRKADDGVYRPLETKQEYKYKAKRKELNAIRKNYKDFLEYARNMLAIDSKMSRDYQQNEAMCKELGLSSFKLLSDSYWSDTASKNRKVLLAHVVRAQETNDLDLLYKLSMYCGITFGFYSYMSSHYECSPDTLVRGFSEVLKYEFNDKVFEAKEVPIGEAFIDRNAKYVQ